MSTLKKIIDFIGGKDPEIFDDNGQVSHKLPKKKWDDWNNRLIQSAEYNWREHKGHQAGSKTSSVSQKK